MIDQGEHISFACAISHALRFRSIHGHRLLTEYSLAMLKRSEHDLHVSCRRGNYAYEIDVVPGNQFFPIIGDVFDAKLLRNAFSMLAVPARDRDHAGAFAIAEAGNLRSAGKAGADNPNAYDFVIV